MTRSSHREELAIELPGHGYVARMPYPYITGPEDAEVTDDPEEAGRRLRTAQKRYKEMGATDLANELCISRRLVTISYTNFIPVANFIVPKGRS